MTPRSEVQSRLTKLQQHLQEIGLDGALLHGMTNLFYYTGTAQQAHLWVPASGEPVLLVRRVLERARQESPLSRIEPMASLKQLADWVGPAPRIGMELDILPVTLFQGYQRVLPQAEIVGIGAATRLLRAVKSAHEIDLIRGAARICDETFQAVYAALAVGQSELELSALAEATERKAGFQGMLRWRAAVGFECPDVHVLAGESALAPSFGDTVFGGEGLTPAAPYGAGRRRVERNMPVCLDQPTAYDGYIHDQTRTLCIGRLDPQLERAHAVCQEIHTMFEEKARPGVVAEDLWEASLVIARRAGLEEHFMGYGEHRARFVGHGVGLELDEWPVLAPKIKQPLQAGNVIALEPKFFFVNKGAVGLESTYAISAEGVECLTLTSLEIAYK